VDGDLIYSSVDGISHAYLREYSKTVRIDVVTGRGWYPSIQFDVNRNSAVDANVDIGFGSLNLTEPCTQYRISENTWSSCGTFHSNEKYRFSEEGNNWIFSRTIPKTEITSDGTAIAMTFLFYNVDEKSYKKSGQVTYGFKITTVRASPRKIQKIQGHDTYPAAHSHRAPTGDTSHIPRSAI
jgi:hypothetical protein